MSTRFAAFPLLASLVLGLQPVVPGMQSRPALQSYAFDLRKRTVGVLKKFTVPAAAIALIQDDKIAYLHAFSADGRMPVGSESVFGVASLSKLVAAWGIMHLVDRGNLDLDAPISRYLTPQQLARFSFDASHVTVRQLLSHTSGLSSRSAPEYWNSASVPSLIDELAARTQSGAPALRQIAPPGTAWNYSGGGYGLLQLIVEDVTGETFSQYMRTEILEPLGMLHSFYGNPERMPSAGVIAHVDEAGKPVQRKGYANLAAAALYTTIADFAKLALADVTRNTHGVLKPADLELMEQPAPGTAGTFGLGYFLEKTAHGEKIVGHDGSDVGWNSMYRAIPARHAAFIMFTDSSTGIAAYAWAICGWYKAIAGEVRKDYCNATGLEIIVALYTQGVDAAAEQYAELKQRYGTAFNFSEAYWNFVGYQMLARQDPGEAVKMFALISSIYPNSANAFDSLGDGYLAAGNVSAAIVSYRRALALDPGLKTAQASLAKLTPH